MKRTSCIIFCGLLFLSCITFGTPRDHARAEPVEEWVARYNGPGNGHEETYAIALDSTGNIYITGMSYGNGTESDFITIKYSPTGEELWTARYNGPQNHHDVARAIAVGTTGNIYVTGWSYGVGTHIDFATVAYDSSGCELWVTRYSGPGDNSDYAHAMTIDSQGHIYVTGWSNGCGTDYDYLVVKYDSDGNELWSARYDGPGDDLDRPHDITSDSFDNIYITGFSYGGNTSGTDYATISYDSSGNQRWVARYNGPVNGCDKSRAITVSDDDTIYVTGWSSGDGSDDDIATICYDSSGTELWVTRYNSPGNGRDQGSDIICDDSGNIYITGGEAGNDPVTTSDFVTIKYDSSGDISWVANYNGPGDDHDSANAITMDSHGNLLIVGHSRNVMSDWDYATIKYDPQGNELWVARHNCPGFSDDWGYALALDSDDNLLVTGWGHYGEGDWNNWDCVTIKYSADQPPNQPTGDIEYQIGTDRADIGETWSPWVSDGNVASISTDKCPTTYSIRIIVPNYQVEYQIGTIRADIGETWSPWVSNGDKASVSTDKGPETYMIKILVPGWKVEYQIGTVLNDTFELWSSQASDGDTASVTTNYLPSTFKIRAILSPEPPNQPPVADTGPNRSIYEDVSVTFDGSGSIDPDGSLVSYNWDFGDGNGASGVSVSHIYPDVGDYTVTLTVTDDDGDTDTDTCTVYVQESVPPPPDDDWPMFNHDPEHTGYSTSDAPDSPNLLWTFVDNQRLSSPSVANGMVLVASWDGTLYALNIDNGEEVWNGDIWGVPSQPVIVNERVFVSSKVNFVNHIYCFDVYSGDLLWKWDTYSIDWLDDYFISNYAPPLTAANDRIYFCLNAFGDEHNSNHNFVFCLDDDTGNLIWNANITDSNNRYMNASLTVTNSKIFLSSQNNLYGLSESNGELLWKFHLNLTTFYSAPAFSDDRLYIGNDNTEEFYCLNANTGDVIWRKELNETNTFMTSSIVDNKVIVTANEAGAGGCGDPIYALDKNTGNVLWRYDYRRLVISTGAVADDKVFLSYEDGTIRVLDLNNGNYLWKFTAQDQFNGWHESNAIAYGKLFSTIRHILYVFGPGEPMNQNPFSNAEPDVQTVGVEEVADFSGCFSYDPDGYIVSYEWGFGDGTVGNGVNVSHIYYNPGNYTVTLKVTDNDGAEDTDTVSVTVVGTPSGNQPPVAYAEPEHQHVDVGESAWFSANGSYDPDGDIVSYEWDFGDGTGASGVNVYQIYYSPGNYTVVLTVTDNEGASDSEWVNVQVFESTPYNEPPVADASPDQQTLYVGEEAWFTANSSYDPDGHIVSFEWGFGDGTNGTGMTVSHVYNSPGNYSTTLFVTDDDGATSTDSVLVTVLVTPSLNQPPVADADPDHQTTDVGMEVWFSGVPSSDSDGNIVSYHWDFGDVSQATGETVSHIFNSPGDYSITLTVTDDEGASDSDSVSVTINEVTGETGYRIGTEKLSTPEVEFWSDWEWDGEPAIVTYDGLTCPGIFQMQVMVPELNVEYQIGTVMSGTETWSDWAENGEVAAVTYPFLSAPGTIQMRIIVPDYLVEYQIGSLMASEKIWSEWASDGDVAQVTWSGFSAPGSLGMKVVLGPSYNSNQPPVADADTEHPQAEPGVIVRFSGEGSYDPDGVITAYNWDFGDGTYGGGETASHVYDSQGNYTIKLTVTDNEGASDSDWINIRVFESQPPENQAPFTDADPDHQVIYEGGVAWFFTNNSYDPDGYIASYHWDFGDGTSRYGETVAHIYEFPGNYPVELTLTDDDGDTASDLILVSVLEIPPSTPPDDSEDEETEEPAEGQESTEEEPASDVPDEVNKKPKIDPKTDIIDKLKPEDIPSDEEEFKEKFDDDEPDTSWVEPSKGRKSEDKSDFPVVPITISISSLIISTLCLSMPLYMKMSRKDILKNKKRKAIFKHISGNPGNNFNGIKQALGLTNGVLSYHLKVLEREKFISSMWEGGYKRFYLTGKTAANNIKRLNGVQKDILHTINTSPGISQTEIAEKIGVTVQVVNYHIKRLQNEGLVRLNMTNGHRSQCFLNACEGITVA